MPFVAMLIAFVAGAVTPLQAGLNSTLRGKLGHPLHATFVNFAVGTLIVAVMLSVMRVPLPAMSAIRSAPWWAWLGGACGVTLVCGSVIALKDLGYAGLVVGIVCGQVVCSLLLDKLGLFGQPIREVSPLRMFGFVLVLGGVAIFQFAGRSGAGGSGSATNPRASGAGASVALPGAETVP